MLSDLLRPVNAGSRHNLSTEDIFLQRKDYFFSLFSQCWNQKNSPKIVHIAGTKGKGSTVQYVSTALEINKKKVGVFTSPHIHTARERVRIGLNLISQEDFFRLGSLVLNELKTTPWSVFFDRLLAMSLRYFAEQSVDFIVLEAGIGGRFDSTNFLPQASACVITSISLDHQAVLGETIEKIAWQKAGIIKAGSNVFTPANQPPSVLRVFQEECDKVGATLHTIQIDHSRMPILSRCRPSLAYPAHLENACLSAAAARHLLSEPQEKSLDSIFWEEVVPRFYLPCRMEHFLVPRSGSLPPQLVVVDGCHNQASVYLFLSSLRSTLPAFSELIVLFGMGEEKCVNEMAVTCLSLAHHILPVQSSHFKSLSEPHLNDILQSHQSSNPSISARLLSPPPLPVQCDSRGFLPGGSVSSRLDWVLEHCDQLKRQGKQTVICVCGSLFTAADARKHIFDLDPSQFSTQDWVREAE